MPDYSHLTTEQLREALQLSEQIDTIQKRLAGLFGGATVTAPVAVGPKTRKGGKRTMSPAARAKIAAAAKARWARQKGTAPAAVASAPKKRGPKPGSKRRLTPEGRARLAAAMKARWAARKKASGGA